MEETWKATETTDQKGSADLGKCELAKRGIIQLWFVDIFWTVAKQKNTVKGISYRTQIYAFRGFEKR